MKNTLEQNVADIILQNSEEIKIGDKIVKVPQPVTSTLIEVSKYISFIPEMKISDDVEEVLAEVLRYAHESDSFADILAIMMLGRKRLTETLIERKYLIFRKTKVVNNQAIVKDWLLDNFNSDELYQLMSELFKMLKVDFFLAITTFLKEVNLTKKTKNETIAFGS